MAITDYLERGALINPDGPCVSMGDERYTYREFLKLTNRIANTLVAAGFGVGRNAAILSHNDPLAYACLLGTMRSGMANVSMDVRNSPEDNYHILDFGDCEVLFYQSPFHQQIQELQPKLPKLKHLACIDRGIGKSPALNDWVSASPDTAPGIEVPIEATARLQTTSGTAGDFKMAMLSHRTLHAFISHHLWLLPDPAPVMLVAAPITHAAGGLSYHVLACGGSLILLEKPDPQLVLSAIEKHRITKLFLPPTAIYRLLAQPNVSEFDYSSLKYLIFTGAPMSVQKLRTAIEVFGPVLTQIYGQTEALGITSMSPHEYFVDGRIASDARLSACGRPTLPFCRVAIMDEKNALVPVGDVGEICARGDQAMSGYYKNPYGTLRTIIDGWVHTGDLGYQDEEGYLHVVDRKKDMIITGGFNVFASEVEQVILSFDAVEDCAVIGVPDEDWGEAVKAVVELVPGKTLSATDIIETCKQRLGSVKSPKTVDFVDQLPRSTRGKVLKRVLREQYWQGRTTRI